MTSSGKIRIYELSRDLNLDNKDVLDAARKLSISAKSHSSSISELDATKIKSFLTTNKNKNSTSPAKQKPNKEILSLKKNTDSSQRKSEGLDKKNTSRNKDSSLKRNPVQPQKDLSKKAIPPSALTKKNEILAIPEKASILESPRTSPTKQTNISKQQSLNSPKQPKPPSTPIHNSHKKEINPPVSRQSVLPNKSTKTNQPKAKPNIIGTPKPRPNNIAPNLINKPSKDNSNNLQNQPPRAPQRPVAPTPRPKASPKANEIISQTKKTNAPSKSKFPQERRPLNQPPINSNQAPGGSPRRPSSGRSPVELVGAPIRRNNKPNNTLGKSNKDNRSSN